MRPALLDSEPRGWTDILPGPGLRGWTRVPLPPDGPKVKDLEIWRVDSRAGAVTCNGHLPTDGKPKPGSHEFLRYDRELGDFVFHVEWRYTDPRRPGWNSGVFARSSADGRIWHQAQTPGAGASFWFGDSPGPTGAVARNRIRAAAHAVNPPGLWNAYEITARGGTLELWVNGFDVCKWTGVLVPRGYIGLEAEYHAVEFRVLRLRHLV